MLASGWEMRLISILCPDEERIEQGSDSARNKWTHPLFDTERFARNIEAAYRQMCETWRARRGRRHFDVRPSCGDFPFPQ